MDDATLLEVAKLTDHPELTEGDTINLEVEVSKDETFTQAVPLPCSVKNGTASVTAGELEEVVKEIYGKAPYARTIYTRATIYIVSHTSAIALPEKITLGKIEATPEALFIDTAYYLIGDVNKWNSEALIKFGHSGKDVYEDPVFSMIVEMPKDECYWKIIPQSNVDGGDIWAPGALGVATNGDDSESGLLVTENPQAGKIPAKGWVKITLNMLEYTYKIEALGNISPFLYVPGGHQGWKPETAPYLYSTDMTHYDGYIYMDADNTFKLTSQKDWDGTNYGYASDTELSTDGGAGNLSVTETGFYRIEANLSTLTYKFSKTEWGIIGDATQGGWDNSTPMTLNAETGEWSITTELAAGNYKFRANNKWDINLGGDLNHLTYGGDNITTEAGTYVITLKLYTAGPVDEKGIQTFSAKNAGLTKFISGDQYMITSIDVSNNPGLAYLDINRCKSITSLNASGCPLTYVDLRNLAGTYSVLGYSGGAVDASKVQFSFTDSSSTQRKLLVEEWWMDSPWNGTSPCITAKNQGVRIERYEYIGYDKDKMLSSFN